MVDPDRETAQGIMKKFLSFLLVGSLILAPAFLPHDEGADKTVGAGSDAFSRSRVSNPVTLFDVNFQYDLQPLLAEEIETDNGTVDHAPTYSGALLSTVDTGDAAALQSRRYVRYTPGKSQLILITGVLGTCNGTVKRMGYFDDNNGVFFQQDADCSNNFVVRSDVSGSVVNNKVAQSSWNLDPLDGTGPSRITLDATKDMIVVMDLQWLGMGRVRVGFDIDGDIIYVHEYLHANVIAVPYMRTANLPIRWEIDGDVADTFYAVCASVQSEGGAETSAGIPVAYASGSAITAGSGSQVFALALRPAATFNSIVNRSQIQNIKFATGVTGTNDVLVRVFYNATVTGGTWAAASSSSAVEVNTTATISGGTLVAFFVVTASNQASSSEEIDLLSRLPFTLSAAGAAYANLAVTVEGVGGTSATYNSARWEEVR